MQLHRGPRVNGTIVCVFFFALRDEGSNGLLRRRWTTAGTLLTRVGNCMLTMVSNCFENGCCCEFGDWQPSGAVWKNTEQHQHTANNKRATCTIRIRLSANACARSNDRERSDRRADGLCNGRCGDHLFYTGVHYPPTTIGARQRWAKGSGTRWYAVLCAALRLIGSGEWNAENDSGFGACVRAFVHVCVCACWCASSVQRTLHNKCIQERPRGQVQLITGF